MRVADLTIDGKGVFYYINKSHPLPLVGVDVNSLDTLFNMLYGNRGITKLADPMGELTETHMTQLGAMLSILFSDKWDSLYEVISAKVPLETYNLTTTETVEDVGSSSSDTTNEHNKTDNKSVTGFDSEEFVDDSLSMLEGVDTMSNQGSVNNTRERVVSVKGNVRNSLEDRINTVKYLKNDFIYDTIFIDVIQKIGKLIF